MLLISHFDKTVMKYTYLQNRRMRRCRVAPPPPIIFERLKLLYPAKTQNVNPRITDLFKMLISAFIFNCHKMLLISHFDKTVMKYTHLQNRRMRRCRVAPPPIIFERLKLPQQIIYRRKENLSESPNHQKYWENILVSRFYEQFSRTRRNLGHFRKFEKISNLQNMNILYIILKQVIWRFQIYNLFREILKFREDKSNNVVREIRKCFRKTAKFEFFAKKIIYLESPDHLLQNDI